LQSFIDCRGETQWKCGGGGGGGGKTIEMWWRWLWWRENNRKVGAVEENY